jgi:hypothetical protein
MAIGWANDPPPPAPSPLPKVMGLIAVLLVVYLVVKK